MSRLARLSCCLYTIPALAAAASQSTSPQNCRTMGVAEESQVSLVQTYVSSQSHPLHPAEAVAEVGTGQAVAGLVQLEKAHGKTQSAAHAALVAYQGAHSARATAYMGTDGDNNWVGAWLVGEELLNVGNCHGCTDPPGPLHAMRMFFAKK